MEVFIRCSPVQKGSTKDTNGNSSGIPLVYCSVPCYLPRNTFFVVFAFTAQICSLCCLGRSFIKNIYEAAPFTPKGEYQLVD